MAISRPALPGALVVSLDFELQWGVRDKHDGRERESLALVGARVVVPRLLELFEKSEIAATWAVVGFLFARSRDELKRFSPTVRPEYSDVELSPYDEPLGSGEKEDPLHFSPSLIGRIQRTPRQEVATHTFSHYYSHEPGQTREAFREDLIAARALALLHGVQLRSIVFPRNQHNPAYDEVLLEMGIRAYRGNPLSGAWRFSDMRKSARRWRRLGRLSDAYLGRAAPSTTPWTDVPQSNGLSDVRASCFLRPYRPEFRYLEPVRLNRIRRGIRFAAREGRIFHLWWHPHNFGTYQEENLRFLRAVLFEFAECRRQYGMLSLSMADVDVRLRSASASTVADDRRTAPPAIPVPKARVAG